MNARERAEAFWASVEGECDPGCIECVASIDLIASAIEAAEAAAYERAAKACRAITPPKDWDGWKARDAWSLARGECEEAVRSLAKKGGEG